MDNNRGSLLFLLTSFKLSVFPCFLRPLLMSQTWFSYMTPSHDFAQLAFSSIPQKILFGFYRSFFSDTRSISLCVKCSEMLFEAVSENRIRETRELYFIKIKFLILYSHD